MRKIPRVAADEDGAGRETRLTVLVGDPLMRSAGEPMGSDWRLPYERLANRLKDDLARSRRRWTLELYPATPADARREIPRARFLVILCHGDDEALAFEQDGRPGWLHAVTARTQLRPFFASAPPDVVLVLACEGVAAARAIQRAGVGVTLGIDKAHYMSWTEAVDLTAAFFGALAAGHAVEYAVDQAKIATLRERVFKHFGSLKRLKPLPEGDVTTAPVDAWAPQVPSEVFVGQKTALAGLLGLLSKPGLVHVSGVGGCGKTELARALLDRCRLARRPLGGSAFVELEGVNTPEGVVEALRRACPPTLATPAGATPAENASALGAALGPLERLLVLDHADDALLVDAARETLEAFLRHVVGASDTRQLRVVVTAGEGWPTSLAAESVQVPSLSPSESQRLLEGIVRGSFVIDVPLAGERWGEIARAPDLPELLHHLDGHPFSIVMAGRALARGVPLADVSRTHAGGEAAGLTTTFDRLRERLEAVSPGISALWWLLAELRGGLPGTTQLPAEDQRRIDLLHRQSACEGDASRRFVTHPVWRYLERARREGRLDPGDAERRARWHAAAATGLVAALQAVETRLRGADGAAALRAFEALRPTVALLLEPANAQAWAALASCRGRLTGLAAQIALHAGEVDLAWQWTDGADTAPDREDDRARVLLLRATAAAARYDRVEEERCARLAQQQASQRGEKDLEAWAWRQLGDVSTRDPRADAAPEQHYTRALTMFRIGSNERGAAQALCDLGLLARRRSETTTSVRHYREALALFRSCDDRLGEARVRRALGQLAQLGGNPVEAEGYYLDAAEAFERLGRPLERATVALDLGSLLIESGDLVAARQDVDEARRVYARHSEPIGQAHAWRLLGDLARQERDAEGAAEAYLRARDFYERASNHVGLEQMMLRLGQLALDRLDAGEAERCARQVRESAPDDVTAAAAYLLEAQAHWIRDDRVRTRVAALDAYARAHRAAVARSQTEALRLLARPEISGSAVARRLTNLLAKSPVPDGAEVEVILGRLRAVPDPGVAPNRRRHRAR